MEGLRASPGKECLVKIVKRIVVVLVVCLALVGVRSLLKKPPQLNLSDEDVSYFEREYGKSVSNTASREGLSGVMMNVEGAPPLVGAGFGAPTGAPPVFMSNELPPPFTPPTGTNLPEAPAFAATDEAPPFGQATAPPFAPTAVPAQPAAPVAAPFQAPIAPPVQKLEEAPAFEPSPVPVTITPPPNDISPPTQGVAQGPPPAWNGPTTDVINMPSSDEPQEGLAVSEAAPAAINSQKSPWDLPVDEAEPLRNETPGVAFSPYKRLPVVVEEEPVETASEEVKPAVDPFLASPPQASPLLVSMADQSKAVEVATPPATEAYRHTSVRKDVVFTKPEPVKERDDVEPVVSFSVQKNTPSEEQASPQAASLTGTQATPQAKAPTTDLAAVLRPTVTRFVKAQNALANSGDPIKMRNAFIQLSKLYEQTELNDAERLYIRPTLDRLALSIVYSRNIHILEPVYTVKSGDTIESIASSYQVTPSLIRKINGLTGGQPLVPGTELKVVLGRFDAKISVSRQELTLILGGLYAGCFPVKFAGPVADHRGDFYVTSKTVSPQGQSLTLNNGTVLLGSASSGNPSLSALLFGEQDLREVFDILTEMSVIVFEN